MNRIIEDNLFKDAMIVLKRNRTRTLLSGCAVAGGMFILLIALAGYNIFYNGSIGNISKLSMETVVVNTLPTTMDYSGFGSGRLWDFDMEDLNSIQSEFSGTITGTYAVILFPGLQPVLVGNGTKDYANVLSMTPGLDSLMQISMVKGRFIDELDMRQKRKVCVVGLDLYKKWFGDGEEACGQDIRIGNIMYTIVGVLKKDNPFVAPFGNEQNSIVLPCSTTDAVYGLNGNLTYLGFSLKVAEGYGQQAEEILRYLRQIHKVNPDDSYSVETVGMQEYSQMLDTLFGGTKVLIWVIFIGIIISSLLGVFGIMLLSVRERRGEIAVRLSMGARPRDIVRQCVYESLVISVSFSLIGMFVAELAIVAMRLLIGIGILSDPLFGMPQLSFFGILSVTAIVITGGVLSGYYPARKMAVKNISELFYDI